VARDLPDFAEVLRRFGSPPIRSTATLGGNIANGSPSATACPACWHWAPRWCCAAQCKGKEETRRVKLEDFYLGLKRNVLQPGEFIEAIEVPRPINRHFRAHKISKRFEQDISATCAAHGAGSSKAACCAT
jgi:xanthine dehydrogenase small subunit